MIILIKQCKIPYKNLDKVILFLRNQLFCLKILKTSTSSNYPTVQYFLLKLCAHFLLTNFYKRVCGIFLFCLDLELFAKIKKDLVSTPSFYTLVKITDYLNKKKTLHNLLYTLPSIKRVQNLNKKY